MSNGVSSANHYKYKFLKVSTANNKIQFQLQSTMLETQVYAYHGPITLYLAGYDVPHPMHYVISTFITS